MPAEPGADGQLQAWAAQTLPRTTRHVGAYIRAQSGIAHESRAGLIRLLHRPGLEHRKPRPIARKLEPVRQAAFVAGDDSLPNHLEDEAAVPFGDAVHPAHEAHPVGCGAPRGVALAIARTTGRDHLNIRGAIDLQTGRTVMRVVESVNAQRG